MKKIVYTIILLLSVSFTSAQTTETYPNSQRYWFDTMLETSTTSCGPLAICIDYSWQTLTHGCIFCNYGLLARKITVSRSNSTPVYGIAIIYALAGNSNFDYDCNDTATNNREWDIFLDHFSVCPRKVFFMTSSDNGDSLLNIVDSATIDFETTAVGNNLVVIPDIDRGSFCCPDYHVIEVYFKHPIIATDTFWIGNELMSYIDSITIPNWPYSPYIGPYYTINLVCNTLNPPSVRTYHYNNDGTASSPFPYRPYQWGGFFPIIAPPPCFKPAYPRVSNIGAWHATVRWDIPVGVQFFNLEYGPAGFTPGTGTTILNITADSCLLSGLTELTQYDVYITGWCSYQQTFSDTVHIDFTTRPLCDTAQGLNATRTNTIIRAWWQQPATADFSELEYGPRNFAPGSGTTISPVNANAAHSCVVVIDSLTPGTDYTLRVRSWCSPTSSFSDWVQMDISTVASPVQPDAPVMSLSPNPAEGSVFVSLSDIMTLLELRDLQGRTLLSISPNSPQAVIDLSNLPAAVYIVTASSPSGSASRKLTVK